MDCPKCPEGALVALTVDEVEVDRCPTCEGIFFDRAELGELLDRDAERVAPILGGSDDEDRNARTARCPRDDQPMMRVTSLRNREVTVDSCAVCQGVWLDGGEFARIKLAQPKIRLGDLI